MKIDGGAPNLDPAAAKRTDQTSGAGAAQAGKTRDAGVPGREGDRVELSNDAQFVSEAIRTAGSAPDIRADVVERMRAKLAAGEVGSDPERLADRIIDTLLNKDEP